MQTFEIQYFFYSDFGVFFSLLLHFTSYGIFFYSLCKLFSTSNATTYNNDCDLMIHITEELLLQCNSNVFSSSQKQRRQQHQQQQNENFPSINHMQIQNQMHFLSIRLYNWAIQRLKSHHLRIGSL